jgi:hypothetical protein
MIIEIKFIKNDKRTLQFKNDGGVIWNNEIG